LGLDLVAVQEVALVVLELVGPVEPAVDTSSVEPGTAASNTGNIAYTEHIVVDSFQHKGSVRHSFLVVFLEGGCTYSHLRWLMDDYPNLNRLPYLHLYPTNTSRWIL